ncbi:MAG TPA: hypothetical protein VGD06_05685, partial [Acidobacteriota bacterium]
MKKLATGAAFVGIWLAVGSQTTGVGALPWPAGEGLVVRQASPGSSEALQAELNPAIRQYCAVCHNDRMLTGNLSLETFDVAAAHERAEVAEKMIVKL